MIGNFTLGARLRLLPDSPPPFTTLVDLTWQENQVEHWIRFGCRCSEQILDRHRSVVGFSPGSVFAVVRWNGNDHGTVVSRIDIVRAIGKGEPFQTLPSVRPGGEILLKAKTWPTVERTLLHVDAIEALGIDPIDVDPDHWRHVHGRQRAGEPPSRYTLQRHEAWLKRRKASS